MPRKKVGLALGGGSARGLAHIGVLEVLEREGIPIDLIAGTSMGALVGALYAMYKDVTWLRNLVIDLGAKRLMYFADFSLPRTGLIKGRKIENVLKETLGVKEFSDLRIPLTCVATDIDSGEEIIINKGLVWEGIRASGSLPVLFSLARWDDRYLVDGGLVNPVPVDVARQMGADVVIAVNVMSNWNVKATKEPNIFNVAMQSLQIASYGLISAALRAADVVIEPDMAHIGFADLHRARECTELGERAALNAVPEIKKLLADGRPSRKNAAKKT